MDETEHDHRSESCSRVRNLAVGEELDLSVEIMGGVGCGVGLERGDHGWRRIDTTVAGATQDIYTGRNTICGH